MHDEGRNSNQKRKIILFTDSLRLNKQTLLIFVTKFIFIQFCFVDIWRTLPSFQLQPMYWGPYFTVRAACYFNYRNKSFEMVLLPHLYSLFLSLNFFSKTSLCPCKDSRFKVLDAICTVRRRVSLYNEILPLLSTECQQYKKKYLQQTYTK